MKSCGSRKDLNVFRTVARDYLGGIGVGAAFDGIAWCAIGGVEEVIAVPAVHRVFADSAEHAVVPQTSDSLSLPPAPSGRFRTHPQARRRRRFRRALPGA